MAAGRVPAHRREALLGAPLSDLVWQVYAEAELRPHGTEAGTSADVVAVAVASPEVPWFAGTLIAAELVKDILGLPTVSRRVDLDVGVFRSVSCGSWEAAGLPRVDPFLKLGRRTFYWHACLRFVSRLLPDPPKPCSFSAREVRTAPIHCFVQRESLVLDHAPQSVTGLSFPDAHLVIPFGQGDHHRHPETTEPLLALLPLDTH